MWQSRPYGSASEVVREALRLFETYQSVWASTLVALKGDLQEGMAAPQAGRVARMTMAAIKAEGRDGLSKRAP
jgi:antitoxin ParD1/3/4